jgi:heat shock protein 4
MACVGFDIGSRFSVAARVHSRGLTTCLNEASKRKSGTLVSIKGKQRFLGANAEPMQRQNYKNTVCYCTRLLGRKFNSPEVQEELSLMPFRDIFEEAKDGSVNAVLSYDGEPQRFTMTQCYAMMLGELNRLAISDAPDGVNKCDVVLTVPSWYDDRQRREVKAACNIAQVQDLGLINDSTAVALGWGIWKNKRGLFNAEAKEGSSDRHIGPCNVMFIDFGDSQMTCSIVKFTQDQMQMLTTTNDKMLGGRLIDMEIAKYLASDFKGGDIFSKPKALIKLLAAAEKVSCCRLSFVACLLYVIIKNKKFKIKITIMKIIQLSLSYEFITSQYW